MRPAGLACSAVGMCCRLLADAIGDGAGTPPTDVFRMSRLTMADDLRPVDAGTKAWQPGRMVEDEDEVEVLLAASKIPAARAA